MITALEPTAALVLLSTFAAVRPRAAHSTIRAGGSGFDSFGGNCRTTSEFDRLSAERERLR